MTTVDLDRTTVRELNAALHALEGASAGAWRVLHPKGKHAIAAGLRVPVSVQVEGHVGYYCAGMNQRAEVTVAGHAGTGLAENIMSGVVRVAGNASQGAAASGHGGLVVIEGDASSRCAISIKGVDVVVGGSIGHMGAFMAQAGRLVVCGDAGPDLGDSIYEAEVYVGGAVARLGSDCIEKEMTPELEKEIAALVERAGVAAPAGGFRRFGSARRLYHFAVEHADAY